MSKHFKECKDCKENLPLEDFYVIDKLTGKTKNKCKLCYKLLQRNKHITREEYETTKDVYVKEVYRKRRSAYLMKNYGITLDEQEAMLDRQDHKCAICRGCIKEGIFHTDHSHESNKVREILCIGCNLLLGQAKDNIKTLKSAIKYLEKHQ